MHKSATKCNETLGKWCKNKHGASKIMDTSETYQISQYDSCVYIKFVDRSPIYLLLYVDDMLIAAKSKKEITRLKA
jgi:hypothetical protein